MVVLDTDHLKIACSITQWRPNLGLDHQVPLCPFGDPKRRTIAWFLRRLASNSAALSTDIPDGHIEVARSTDGYADSPQAVWRLRKAGAGQAGEDIHIPVVLDDFRTRV